jgi:hypothetical protein
MAESLTQNSLNARYLNGIPLEKALTWFFERLGLGSILDHNSFNPSIYPNDNHNVVDIVLKDKALFEATNPKASTWLSDDVMSEKLNYFNRADPKHLLLWVLVVSFANFSDYVKQQINKLGIILIVLGETATKNNLKTFKRNLFTSKLYALTKRLTRKPKSPFFMSSSQTTLTQYDTSSSSLSHIKNLYQHQTTIDIDNPIVSSNPVVALLQEARRLKKLRDSFKEHGIDLD